MSTTMRKSAVGILAAAAVVLAGGTAFAQETFKLGGVISATGGGASIGRAASVAWKLAVDDVNANGGILGKQVELVIADTMTDPTHGVSEARRLLQNENVQAIIGPATSQETIPIATVTTEAKVLHVSTAASPTLTPEAAPYHFSTSVTAVNQMIPNIDFAVEKLGLKNFGIISDNGGMSKAGVSEIVAYLKEQGLEPAAVQEFPFRTEDMTPQLLSMRSSGADAILLVSSLGDDARKLLENRLDIGWEAPVLANATLSNYAVGHVDSIGEEAFENVYSTTFIGMTYCEGDPVGENAFAKFSARAAEEVPELEMLGGPGALAPYYIIPLIVADAINGAGSADGEAIAQWLTDNAAEVELPTGPLEVTATSHFLPALESLVTIESPHLLREDGLAKRANCDA